MQSIYIEILHKWRSASVQHNDGKHKRRGRMDCHIGWWDAGRSDTSSKSSQLIMIDFSMRKEENSNKNWNAFQDHQSSKVSHWSHASHSGCSPLPTYADFNGKWTAKIFSTFTWICNCQIKGKGGPPMKAELKPIWIENDEIRFYYIFRRTRSFDKLIMNNLNRMFATIKNQSNTVSRKPHYSRTSGNNGQWNGNTYAWPHPFTATNQRLYSTVASIIRCAPTIKRVQHGKSGARSLLIEQLQSRSWCISVIWRKDQRFGKCYKPKWRI